jgi:enamine deaminase RidA (YjgF/YER057c/UK114 family)
MTRTAIDPVPWGMQFGFHQGEVVAGASKVLVMAGQAATSAEGAPQHPGDLPAQVSLALDNMEAVLRDAGMTPGDVIRYTVYTTDVDAMLGAWEGMVQRFAAAGASPPSTLIGVSRLAFPELMVEIEATAAA